MNRKLLFLILILIPFNLIYSQEKTLEENKEIVRGLTRRLEFHPLEGETTTEYAMRIAVTYEDAYILLWDFVFSDEGLEKEFIDYQYKSIEHLNQLKKQNTKNIVMWCVVSTSAAIALTLLIGGK